MFQDERLTVLARRLRHHQTDAERCLWGCLRNRRLDGLKFKRQQPIGDNYIVDFVCGDKRLVIELDGSQHTTQTIKDKIRTDYLKSCGFTVLRFWNNDIFSNLKGVLEQIRTRTQWELQNTI